MQLTLLHGYPDLVGKRSIFCGYGNGPKSYVNAGGFAASGDPLLSFAFQYYIDDIAPAISVSGTYIVRAVPSAAGLRPTWNLHWYTESTGTEVSNAVDLSAESVQIMGFGGTY